MLPVAIDVGPLAAPGGALGADPPGDPDPEPDAGDPADDPDPEPDGGPPPAELAHGHGTGGAQEANQIPISGRPQL